MENIEKILKEASADILTDETTQLMKEAFEQEVEKRVSNRLQLDLEEIDKKHAEEVTQLVESIDKTHAEKYQTLLEASDTDHTNKMKRLVSEMDKSYTNRLKIVKEHYEVKQMEEMENFKNTLLESIDQHIDNILEEKIPADVFHKAAASYVEKKTVNESKTVAKKSTLLESLTKGFDADKKKFIVSKLNGKSDDSINKNFAYVVKMFENKQQTQKQVIAESAVKNSIDSQKEVTLTENKSEVSEQNKNEIDPYMQSLIQRSMNG
jgi:hypothetical protein